MSSRIDGPPATPAMAEDQLPRGLRPLFALVSGIERVGNKLPHPFLLFWILAAILAVVSAVLAALGTSVVLPGTGESTAVRSLLSSDGVAMIFGTALDNFAAFGPLPIIVTVILGVSVAEHSGVLTTLLRTTIVKLPTKWVTFAVAFAGTMSHVMFDAAFIVVLPLAALAFKAAGRSPVLGMMVAFVAISGGYNASPLITPSDAILSSLTTSAAQIVDAEYVVTPVDNYFFSLASSLVISVFITLVVELVMAKHMNLDPDDGVEDGAENLKLELEPAEKKGLRRAGIAFLIYVAVIVAALLPASSPLRGENGGFVQSVVMENVAFFIAIAFVLTGWVYGRTTGSFGRAREIPESMAVGIRTLAPILVLFFAISQFLAYFKWTGIGNVVAVNGAELLKAGGWHPLVVFLLMLVVISIMNLLVSSGSAMWAMLAPVLVPMLMYIDVNPATTQAVYRIADSCTNAMTPMSAYFILTLGLIQRYKKNAGIGTLASFTIPVALGMLIVWAALFAVWYAFGIPLGPGAPIR
ncbi:AbgT family transporter [Rhodococcus sp. ARC_M5]|uniref:AbgT family transporter n=1 Tax=Rhodococcus sp. ARC_M5 TaxID=2928851 RepID=UPI001FB20A1E|nr:AbgT family transporter [Rhodococcus sp. ARC_M5]MCJ0892463.1 AbgT family transporter [Rhodococcus sp. ARC_M5]